jgi:hypothetical protein
MLVCMLYIIYLFMYICDEGCACGIQPSEKGKDGRIDLDALLWKAHEAHGAHIPAILEAKMHEFKPMCM